jgi:hypothetical protein
MRNLMFSIAFIVEKELLWYLAYENSVVSMSPLYFFFASGFFHNIYYFRQIRFFV